MGKKYYTPELEEFYVGFEYEFENLNGWQQRVFNDNDGGYYNNVSEIKLELGDGHIRVKYLDREDIESLGWNYNEKLSIEEFDYEPIDNWEIILDDTEGKEKYYILFIHNNILYIQYHEYQNSVGRTEEQFFKGTIKNKSELKKLLKQLGI